MVQTIEIENYKSIQNLRLELGRINVLIGENGCGKSNILEAIALGSAAVEHKLDNEYLANRGIRITDAKLMRAAFEEENLLKDIKIHFGSDLGSKIICDLQNDNKPYSKWKIGYKSDFSQMDFDYFKEKLDSYYFGLGIILSEEEQDSLNIVTADHKAYIKKWIEITEKRQIDTTEKKKTSYFSLRDLISFLIYSPENTFLRNYYAKVEPLGVRGDGLFRLLQVMSENDISNKTTQIQAIKENLTLINWFEDINVPTQADYAFGSNNLDIKDRFLAENIHFFDERNVNEGFLFLLFYFTLFVSEYTPKFFAIDNIDSSLNPKLCSKLIEILSQLAEKYEKQVILTTHNPAILDGLNLDDDMQRLFVVYRNGDGHTKTRRIMKPETPIGVEPIRLSEAFLRGAIGGLPKTF